ncbi:hypothetical protein EIN_400600 [Entamoeba invadens IP1]|uniref:Transmembrane protein n=2 Tax=Entamoeba invadens TaxID=33085 RepID=A0A0A1UAD9_ENTIV|nr:hypothetical protein EIN_400600 [Entamoeba invadens IP1]ELP91950.1 hypothetical protein EIN_400600 [Entamoeba invadens IP1]BAN41515.1 hypothetical protein [Entamoeba invadens]|eukprot:XP_004258721.1 hypothetical protein EIN_400600 [Entamoeba invadens IP1]
MEGKFGLAMISEQLRYVEGFSTDNVSFPEGWQQYFMIIGAFFWLAVCIAEFFVLLIVGFFQIREAKYFFRIGAALIYLVISAAASFMGVCAATFVYPESSSARFSFHIISIFVYYIAIAYRITLTTNWKFSCGVLAFVVLILLIPDWLTFKVLIPALLYQIAAHFYLIKYHFISCEQFLVAGEVVLLFASAVLDITKVLDGAVFYTLVGLTEILSFISMSEICFKFYEYGRYIVKDGKRKKN